MVAVRVYNTYWGNGQQLVAAAVENKIQTENKNALKIATKHQNGKMSWDLNS